MKLLAKKEAKLHSPIALVSSLSSRAIGRVAVLLLAIFASFAADCGSSQASEIKVTAVATVTDIEEFGTTEFQFPLSIAVGDVGSFQARFSDQAFPRGARFSGGYGAPGITTNLSNINSRVQFENDLLLLDEAARMTLRHDPPTFGTPENPGIITTGEHVSIFSAGDDFGGYAWQTTSYFSTAGDSLAGGELVGDILSGEFITTSKLYLRVTQPGYRGAYEVSAILSEVAVVPEPNAAFISLLAVTSCFCVGRKHNLTDERPGLREIVDAKSEQ